MTHIFGQWRHDFVQWRQISWYPNRCHFVSDIKKGGKRSMLCEKVGIFDNGVSFIWNQRVNWWNWGKIYFKINCVFKYKKILTISCCKWNFPTNLPQPCFLQRVTWTQHLYKLVYSNQTAKIIKSIVTSTSFSLQHGWE